MLLWPQSVVCENIDAKLGMRHAVQQFRDAAGRFLRVHPIADAHADDDERSAAFGGRHFDHCDRADAGLSEQRRSHTRAARTPGEPAPQRPQARASHSTPMA